MHVGVFGCIRVFARCFFATTKFFSNPSLLGFHAPFQQGMLANDDQAPEAPVISGSKPSADQLECTKETAMGHQLGQPRDRVWSAVSSFFLELASF